LVNDNWIGREPPVCQGLSQGEKWLASLARPVWKQIRLGRGPPDLLQKGYTGNTIFLSQPTAEIPTMSLPPGPDGLVDSLTVAFTGSVHNIDSASWARVRKSEYLALVRRRKAECPVFAKVVIDEAEAALLPADGVPEAISTCAVPIEGVERVQGRLKGPASARSAAEAPPVADGAEDEEDEAYLDADGTAELDQDAEKASDMESELPENALAMDPTADTPGVVKFQRLQKLLAAAENEAANVAQHEAQVRVQSTEPGGGKVEDAGGREHVRTIVVDIHAAARALGRQDRSALEAAATSSELLSPTSAEALAVPTTAPLSMFDSKTWAAAFVEFWYGDGTPHLDRCTPLLFEEWARMILDREELEYHVQGDEATYRARSPSRFVAPEILACLSDCHRRLLLLRSTRAVFTRQGFEQDLKTVATATADDFVEAMSLTGPASGIPANLRHEGVPKAVKRALRALLLSTGNVPGTEGRKVQQRHQATAYNIHFGGARAFHTFNFADSYSRHVVELHEGPSAAETGQLCLEEPTMPPLEAMHRILAQDPRAQAKFYLLMIELSYRFCLGIERLKIGRLSLGPDENDGREDDAAATLQPALLPGARGTIAPNESQGRGFVHSHGKTHGGTGGGMDWLRRVLCKPDSVVRREVAAFTEKVLAAATSLQYDSAVEAGRQAGIPDMQPEPFSERQQMQSRMDGGLEDDDTTRDFVPVEPEVQQPHLTREESKAAAEARMPRTGTAAFREVPLTGAYHSILPWYRRLSNFGRNVTTHGAPEPASSDLGVGSPPLPLLLSETGQVTGFCSRNASDDNPFQEASQEELEEDAAAFTSAFARDVRALHSLNHKHDCTETCVKYAAKKAEAATSLQSKNVPKCRFCFFSRA